MFCCCLKKINTAFIDRQESVCQKLLNMFLCYCFRVIILGFKEKQTYINLECNILFFGREENCCRQLCQYFNKSF